MSFVKPKTLSFTPSTSSDVVSYNVRIVPTGTAFGYDIPAANIAHTVDASNPSAPVSVKLSDVVGSASLAAGNYDVFVTAVNVDGNESDPLAISNVPFDLVAPAAPTNGSVA